MITHLPMPRLLRLLVGIVCTCVLATTGLQAAEGADSAFWKARIEGAPAGSTVGLPAGRLEMADVQLPAGVTLSGAGYQRTVIDAAKGTDGLRVTNGCAVRNLTVRKAPGAGISVKAAADVLISGVRVEKCMTGVVLNGAERFRLENSILFANRTGLAGAGGTAVCVVNNTFYNNNSLGLSLIGTKEAAAFNNVIANSATGVYLDGNEGLRLDYNLYLANFIGKIPGHPGPISVQGWRDLAVQDAHSLQEVIAFANPEEGVFAPATRLAWAPGRAPTTGFGTAKVGTYTAPATDLFGHARRDGIDVGAVQEPLTDPGVPAAGAFTVAQADAVVSAGLYTPDGVLVNYLFQNLPLRQGKYPFWLPARDWQGQPIAPGAYEVRTVESNVRMAYKGLAFNTARSSERKDHASFHAAYADFAPDGGVILGCGWSESHLQIRTFDADYHKAGWAVKGSSNPSGMCQDGAGHLYLLTHIGKEKGTGKDSLGLMKVNMADGSVMPVTPAQPAPLFTGVFSEKTDGMAALGGRLFVSDPAAGKLWFAEAASPVFTEGFPVQAPRQVAVDRKNGLLWLISNNQTLLALSPDGKTVHTQEFPHSIDKLAVANGRLAVLSRATGKIDVFTIESPIKLTPTRTLGTGAPPTGKFKPDKFTFKGAATACGVALSDTGNLFVIDWPRTLLFTADGKLKKQTISIWGQHLVQGKLAGDTQPRWWNVDSAYSFTMDSRQGTWAPDGVWTYTQPGLDRYRAAVDFFSDGGRNFALFLSGRDPAKLTLLEFDADYRSKTLAVWHADKAQKGALVRLTDTNKDGIIDTNDAPATPVTGKDGGKVTVQLPGYSYLEADTHDLLFAGGNYGTTGVGQRVRYLGLDDQGIPAFDWAGATILTCKMNAKGTNAFVSPFDFKSPEVINNRVGEFAAFSNGTVAFTANAKSGGGTGFGHVAGSDMAAASPDGTFRWFHPLPLTGGVHGVQIVNDILITQDFTNMDWHLINKDGLGLGIAGIPPAMRWTGMWNDHPRQYRLFKGNDNEVYALLGDYVLTAFHHFKLEGAHTIRTKSVPVKIDAAAAQALVARPPQPVPARVEPPTFTAVIKKVEAPLAIDGDLKKWRTAGVQPQILITPETAGGDVTGPADISGVVRLAHENGNLYVQVIKFDDAVTMHQPIAKHYMQDSVELCINSFLHGFKFNVTRTQEHGDTVFRDRFYVQNFNKVYTAEEVPRSIRVLDSAADVEERTLIESIYGVDLTKSKVIVTEFKLPMAQAFAGDLKAGPSGKSGDKMWIGFMLDDNDAPGSDVQDLLVYPATYGTFALKERGCLATFE
jgi:hypothetical protein